MQTLADLRQIVSIIVPCGKEKDHIKACVRSILAQESPPGGFEVIIADGMSDDGTRDVLKQLEGEDPRVRTIDNPGRIVSSGLNAAIRAAQGRIIIRMDAHTEYASDYIRQCFIVRQETGADDVGGPWVAKGNGLVSSAIAAAFQSPFAVGGARGHNPHYEGTIDTVYLGCWPREVFDRIGLFDEELVRNQDDEFNLRLTRTGGKIWQSPRIKSYYRPRNSLGGLFRQYLQYGYWKVRVIQKHKMPASARHLMPGSFVLSLILLPLLALWFPLLLWGWLGLVGVYSFSNVTVSLLTAARLDWALFPILPLVFACYHFAYGYGFLRGVWDFVIVRQGPAHSYTKMNRIATGRSS